MDEFYLNYDKALADHTLPSYVHDVLKICKSVGVASVGQIIRQIPDWTLSEFQLVDWSTPSSLDETEISGIILMAYAMSSVEGFSIGEGEEMVDAISYTVAIMTIESLKRKGLVEVLYENMTYDPDHSDAPIVKATPDGKSFAQRLMEDGDD